MEPTSLNTIIIDTDIQKRMRLKQATTSLALFKNALQVNSTQEALAKFSLGQSVDIAFLSTRISDDAIKHFIESAKAVRGGRDAAFILVADGKAAESATGLPHYLLLGVDGFLLEPYSVDRLVEVSNLAAKVKLDRSTQRKRLAVDLLLQQVDKALSAVSGFRAAGMQSTRLETQFHKLGESVKKLDGTSKEYFLERMADVWSKMEKPTEIVDLPKYQGASQRVKKIFEEKVLKQLEDMKPKDAESE